MEDVPLPPDSLAQDCQKVIEALGMKATVGR
jgi:hypothetical protein